MTAITLKEAIADLMVHTALCVPVLIIGPVGVGKTDIARQVAKAQARTVIYQRLSDKDPTDFGSPMPNKETKTLDVYLPGWLPNEKRDGPKSMILWDEFTDGLTGTQAVANQVLLERGLQDYKLPDDCVIVATGNRQMDRAAAQKVSRATANRLVIIEIKVDVDAWLEWASQNGISPILISYVQWAHRMGRGEIALHQYPQGGGADAVAFVTPRSLARCSPYLDMYEAGKIDAVQLRRLLAQNVGDTSADDIMTFITTVYTLIPALTDILKNPMSAVVHREPSVNYALTVGLVSHLTMANVGTIVTYVNRLSAPYQAAFWSNALTRNAGFKETAEYIAYKVNRAQAA